MEPRDHYPDALIVQVAARLGATIVTANLADFRLASTLATMCLSRSHHCGRCSLPSARGDTNPGPKASVLLRASSHSAHSAPGGWRNSSGS